MSPIAFIAILVGTVFLTEASAWLLHRYLMHGPLWRIHRTHHEPRTGPFELNDVFGLVYAVPSAALIYVGFRGEPAALAAGLGVLAYGAIYFLLHDALVHHRIDLGLRPRRGYLARIVQAHRLHHAVESCAGCVSFGFILAPSPQRLKAMLRRTEAARLRAPARQIPS